MDWPGSPLSPFSPGGPLGPVGPGTPGTPRSPFVPLVLGVLLINVYKEVPLDRVSLGDLVSLGFQNFPSSPATVWSRAAERFIFSTNLILLQTKFFFNKKF